MTTTISKLKAVYERLQESFTMQNKLEFDQVVWETLPELWKVEQKPATTSTVTRMQSPIPSIIRNYLDGIDKPHTVKMVIKGLGDPTKVTRQQVEYAANKNGNPQKVLRTCDAEFLTYADQPFQNRVRVIYPKDSVEHSVKPIRLSTSPSKPKPIKPSTTTPFIEWFEANYELADGFTPILEIIQKCDHIISEDRAKDQLKSKGYLVYNRPAGGCVQARPIKKQKSEFVNLTEVLKEMK